jgi:hypothetical protein
LIARALERTDVRAALAFVGWGALVWFFSTPPDREIAREMPPAPPGPAPGRWVEVEARSVALAPGRRYRACLSVPWYVPDGLVTVDKIRERAAAEGFADLVATTTRPAGWPAACDWMVEATYAGAARALDLPGAIPHAWELAT